MPSIDEESIELGKIIIKKQLKNKTISIFLFLKTDEFGETESAEANPECMINDNWRLQTFSF